MNLQISPGIILSSLISQVIVTFALKNPNIKWLNRDNVHLISIVSSSILAITTAYASGDINQGLVQESVEAMYNAFMGSTASVAFYEWTKGTWDYALNKYLPSWVTPADSQQ